MGDNHPFSQQLREDFQRLAQEYLLRYSEPALWFPQAMDLPQRIIDPSAAPDPGRIGEYAEIRVLALLPTDYHIQRYGMTPDAMGVLFAAEELRVDDRLVLRERIFPRDTWAKPKAVNAIDQTVVFAVPSFYPVDGTWDNGELIYHAPRELIGRYGQQPPVLNQRYYVRYRYAYVVRVKSIGASWRVEGFESPVFSYHVSIQDE